jgi:hypothetical protein
LRISVKNYSRNKNLKIQLKKVPFAASRQFFVRMTRLRSASARQDGQPRPKSGQHGFRFNAETLRRRGASGMKMDDKG